MAAQRIRAANSSGLPRCKSEGTLIDLGEGFSEASFNDVKGERLGPGVCADAPRLLGCQVHVPVIPCWPSSVIR